MNNDRDDHTKLGGCLLLFFMFVLCLSVPWCCVLQAAARDVGREYPDLRWESAIFTFGSVQMVNYEQLICQTFPLQPQKIRAWWLVIRKKSTIFSMNRNRKLFCLTRYLLFADITINANSLQVTLELSRTCSHEAYVCCDLWCLLWKLIFLRNLRNSHFISLVIMQSVKHWLFILTIL